MNTIFGNFPEKIIPNLKDAIIKFTLSGKDSEMSLQDLSNNLPSSGGGGTNPTSAFIPFNNSGTFADSYLINDIGNSVLKTYAGDDKGLYFDFVNNLYTLGDYAGFNYNTKFIIDDNNQIIKTSNNATDKGLLIDFSNQVYALGNPESGSWDNVNNSDGLMINFSSETISLGYNFSEGVTLYMDNSNETIKTYMGNSNTGLSLDFLNKLYSFGQLNGGNSTKLEIDDNSQKLILSSNLETASGGDPAEKWLKVTIGTTDYLIALLNPAE